MLGLKVYKDENKKRFGMFDKDGIRYKGSNGKDFWFSVGAVKSAFLLNLRRKRMAFNRYYTKKTLEEVIETYPNEELILYDVIGCEFIYIKNGKIVYINSSWKEFCEWMMETFLVVQEI